MSVIATDTNRLSSVLKHEYLPTQSFCREMVTMNDAAATLKVGAVLGKVTATGKYKLVEASASDGSEVAAAVLVGDKDGYAHDVVLANATDTKVQVIVRGPAIVSASELTFGASVDTTPEKQAAYAQLKALGIMVETAV